MSRTRLITLLDKIQVSFWLAPPDGGKTIKNNRCPILSVSLDPCSVHLGFQVTCSGHGTRRSWVDSKLGRAAPASSDILWPICVFGFWSDFRNHQIFTGSLGRLNPTHSWWLYSALQPLFWDNITWWLSVCEPRDFAPSTYLKQKHPGKNPKFTLGWP